MKANAEIVRLIGVITGAASAVQYIAWINKDDALKGIAKDIEKSGWELLKIADPGVYGKVLKYREEHCNED